MRIRHIAILLITAIASGATALPVRAEADVPLGHVEIRGTGPIPMVLISGPTLDWRYWEEFMDRNSEAYTMYAVTLPGMSGSPAMPMPPLWRPPDREDRQRPPLQTPWLDNAVDAIVDMMVEQETGRAVVMGHAMGGLLAIRMGIEHPQLVSAVISIEGAVAFPTPRPMDKHDRAADALWRFDHNLRSISPEDWPATMAKWTMTSDASNKITKFVIDISLDTDQEVCTRYLVEHRMTDLSVEIADLRVPTLAIFSGYTDKTKKGKVVDKTKRAQFGPAWHEEVRFYDKAVISYFYTLQRPQRFDTEIAEYIQAQNITGAPDHDKHKADNN